MQPEPTYNSTSSSIEFEDSGILDLSRVYVELEALRTSGALVTVTELRAGLESFGFDTALSWVEKHPI